MLTLQDHPNWVASSWQLLLIFYAFCIGVFLICTFGNRLLPYVDTVAAVWNGVTILIVLIALSVTASSGRHSASDTLGYYDTSISGWNGFSFFIGLLPAAYTYAALGMIASMAEEVRDPGVVSLLQSCSHSPMLTLVRSLQELPKALTYSVPIAGLAGLFFIIPICATLPPLLDIINDAPQGQGLPYVFHTVMGSRGGGLALMFFILGIALFCSISITTAASRCTWAFARDHAIPLHSIWAKVTRDQTPVNALLLLTLVQMLLGLIGMILPQAGLHTTSARRSIV